MVLCPPRKTLEANLRNHLSGFKHQRAVEDAEQARRQPLRTGRPGRSTKSSTGSSLSTQSNLHLWLSGSASNGTEGMSATLDQSSLRCLLCYGFRGPNVKYGLHSYVVTELFNDPHEGVVWYAEPHLTTAIDLQGKIVQVKGALCHKQCHQISMSAVPFPNLTCSMCALIPLETDFRLRVQREEYAPVKRGYRSTVGGIRLGYLSTIEVNRHIMQLSKQFRLQKLHFWHARTRIVQLKAKRSTMRESAKNASADMNLIKFCNNIINAHKVGAFGGKDAL